MDAKELKRITEAAQLDLSARAEDIATKKLESLEIVLLERAQRGDSQYQYTIFTFIETEGMDPILMSKVVAKLISKLRHKGFVIPHTIDDDDEASSLTIRW